MKKWRPEDWKLIDVTPIGSVSDDVERMLLTTTYEQGADSMLFSLVKWLDEPCENPKHNVHRVSMVSGWKTAFGAYHRKECPVCWQKLKMES